MLGALWLSAPAYAEEGSYAPGQIWSYETAPGDEGSLILIQEVDQIGSDDDPIIVYHITMIGVQVPWLDETMDIAHLPVSQETLDASVTGQVESDAVFPDHREGRQIWDDDNGGVFTITLSEIANFLRDQLAPRMRHNFRS
jgi:hypothetical protein